MTDNPAAALRERRQIAIWLFCLCGFLALVVLVGGMTRLTDSGLSITEWKPVTGILPPLSAQAWESEFSKYQVIPEYRLINSDMTLDAFKAIFWWEWAHRLLARLAGLVFLIPFVYFWVTKKLASFELPKFMLLFVLGGAQGVLGWYMVKSGLSQRVDVSQYRLAAHLGLAFLVYGYSLWMGMDYWRLPAGRRTSPRWLKAGSVALCSAVFAQILMGALVAGLDAGLTYNSWPLMEGHWLPPGMGQVNPLYLNPFENITLVQFNHRWAAAVIFILSLALWTSGRHDRQFQTPLGVMLGIVSVQFILGIAALLAVVPLALAAAHQMGALLTFSAALWLVHRVWKSSSTGSARH
ncbi:MAG: COX15/CtaA family protein [Alphaproteobacteria bacterium]